MIDDIKWIKKHYGEQTAQTCRKLFPRILETPGALAEILKQHFANNRYLIQDIIEQNKIAEFQHFVFSKFHIRDEVLANTDKSAVELLDKAGYILYPECQTEEELQSFKKYYSYGEELCSFWTDRLEDCRVWFAVKKNVDEIKRENFPHPEREDEYGTSVISIQFTHGKYSILSIKNRYNDTVVNPDNTFNNNLDKIIPGLTAAFHNDYGIKDYNYSIGKTTDFKLEGYVCCDEKYYKYNHKLIGIAYCNNNIIIDNGDFVKLSDSQMLIDYFIFDFKNNTVSLYDKRIADCFIDGFKDIEEMTFANNEITIKQKDCEFDVKIKINNQREIVSVENHNLTECGHGFMKANRKLEELNMKNLKKCGNKFLYSNYSISSLHLPKLESCGSEFLFSSEMCDDLDLRNLKDKGLDFMYCTEHPQPF